jgi:hypothetical protein
VDRQPHFVSTRTTSLPLDDQPASSVVDPRTSMVTRVRE